MIVMVMVVIVIVVVMMVVRALAQVRLERRLDLRHLDPRGSGRPPRAPDVDDAHGTLADLGRDVPVAQDVPTDRRLARRAGHSI